MFQKLLWFPIALVPVISLMPIVSQAQSTSPATNLPYQSRVSFPRDYNGPVCIVLGNWEGNTNVRLETDTSYTQTVTMNSTSIVTQALNITVSPAIGSWIRVRSDRNLSPQLNTKNCQLPKSGVMRTESLYWNRK